MAADNSVLETHGARSIRTEERHLEVARELGEHAARIDTLEHRVERELQEIRGSLQRLESQRQAAAPPVAQADPNMMLATQALNRVADAMAKPAAPPPAVVQPSPTNPVAVLGYIIGTAAIAWFMRGIIPGV